MSINTQTQQSLELGVRHHTAGRLAQAEQLYRQVLQADANQPDALHLLGVLAHQTGNSAAALDLIDKSIAIDPGNAEAHNNLGLALQSLGKFDEAEARYRQALILKPEYGEAHANLGNALLSLNKTAQAADSYRKALAIKPGYLKALNNLGLALRDLGQLQEATAQFVEAITINPNYAEAHSNLGNVLKDQGQLDQALAHLNMAIAINPDYGEAFNNLGLALFSAGKIDAARENYSKALAINPAYAEALNNMGLALHALGKVDEALGQYRQAIDLNPGYGEAHNNLANALKEQGHLAEAIAAYRESLRIQPGYEPAAINLLHQLRHACDWNEVAALCSQLNPHALSPFGSVTSNDDGLENLAVARAASAQISLKVSGLKTDFSFRRDTKDKARITIGYLSSDFQNHATAHLLLSLFALHDRDNFKVLTFSHGQNDDSPYRGKIIADSDKFFDLQGVDHQQAAQIIYDAGVDILIDLKGHTQHNRLEVCALRPAPVQVCYLGFPGSSGADFIDYMITDPVVTAAAQEPHFSEQLVFLPGSYQVNDDAQEISKNTLVRADFGLPEQGFVFCCFNGSFKIEPLMFDAWMTLLKETPGSVLWLYKSHDLAEANLKACAQDSGIDTQRLIFTGKLPKDQHLARYRLADLALDTRICGGHTTTSDALWAGVPVITIIGKHFASRVSASLLSAIDVPELICTDLVDYQTLARRLSTNPRELAQIKAKIAHNRLSQPLFDTARFAKNLEAAYSAMWDIYLSDKPPRRIDVSEE